MNKLYVLTASAFAEIERIKAVADRIAGEMEVLFQRDPFPKSNEIASTYGAGRATLMIIADDLARIIKRTAVVHDQDVLDDLTECAAGPHFYDPDNLPDWATDRDYCSECQPKEEET